MISHLKFTTGQLLSNLNPLYHLSSLDLHQIESFLCNYINTFSFNLIASKLSWRTPRGCVFLLKGLAAAVQAFRMYSCLQFNLGDPPGSISEDVSSRSR